MVPKIQKSKSTSNKTSTLTKNASTKIKKDKKLANGHANENENIELNSKVKAHDNKLTKDIGGVESVSDMPENMVIDEAELENTEESTTESAKVPVMPRTRTRAVLKDVKQEKKSETNHKVDLNVGKASDNAKSQMVVESESVMPETSKATKRKPLETKVVNGKKGTVPNIKAKRQKALLEVPKINAVPAKVFVLGENDVGQLGIEKEESKRPTLLELPYSIVDIAAGGMHSVCLTEKGEVLTFGCNDEGALGRVTLEEGSERIPRRVDIPEQVVQVSAGDSHSAALAESGQVYLWGNFRNVNGPMGLVRESVKESAPVKILRDVKVVKISSGSDHLICLSQEGIVYSCGCAEAGQLGRISERSNIDGGRQGLMLLLTPDKVPLTKSLKVDDIWTGTYATFLKIKDSDRIHGCGLNNFNQMGLENQSNKNYISNPTNLRSFNGNTWSQINGGQHHTVALDAKGLVYALGRGEYGRLGLGENSEIMSAPTEIPTLQNKRCVNVSCGNCVSFAVSDDGSVFSWGMGDNYQLGHGNDKDQNIPKLIEGNFTEWKALKIAGGGQHALILATPRKD